MSIRPIWNKPTLTTEWEDEGQEEREIYWVSVFYDLIMVASVSAISDPFTELVEDEEGESDAADEGRSSLLVPIAPLVVNAVLQFLMLVLPWMYLDEITSIFEDESLAGHIAFFVHLLGFATTAAGCVGEVEDNYHNLGRGIILSRIGLIFLLIRPYMYIEKARQHILTRCFQLLVVIGVTLWACYEPEEESFETFRIVLIFIVIWDLATIPLVILLKCKRLRIHLAHYTDRWKDLTMVIFGEAIFSITLQPRLSSGSSNYYLALALTMWLIYSLALHEFHILPRPDDHALRRSLPFGVAWNFTMVAKTVMLLGTSVGIKRVHYLVWANQAHVDSDTQQLLIWGISCTLFCVVLIRSFSFGWGRNPGPHDPPMLALLKIFWWTVITVLSFGPFIMEKAILQADYHPTPIFVLQSLGILMAVLNFSEGIISVTGAKMMGIELESGNNYIETIRVSHPIAAATAAVNYESIPGHDDAEA